MIPYIDRDLIRTFVLAFLTLMAFVLVGALIKSLLELFRFMDGSKLSWFFLMFMFEIPRQTVYAIPVSTAVAVLWTYTVKARTNELLAYLVGGMSPMRIAAPLVISAALLGVANWAITEYLATRGDRAAERIERLHIQGQDLESIVRENNVFQKGLNERFYFLNHFDPLNRRMVHPFVVHLNSDWGSIKWRLDAQYATEVNGDGQRGWGFHEATYREYDADGNLTRFEQRDLILGSEMVPPIEEELDRYLRQRFREDQMTTAELSEYIQLFELQNRPNARIRTIYHFNFAIPLGTLVLAFVMCGHIVRPRASGMVYGFGGGLALLAGYFVLLIFGRELSVKGTIDPILGAYLPNLIFALIGFGLMMRSRAV